MIKFARKLLLQGNDFVVYVASCRLNAYHAHLSTSRKTEHFEKLQVWDKMRYLLRAHELDRKEQNAATPEAQVATGGFETSRDP
jgi:hypothetical protein